MTASMARFMLLCFCLFGTGMAAAQPITTVELQKMLQSAPKVETPFHEQRQSPWLASPVESRGVVRSLPQGLEKQVQHPKRETWRLLSDRLEWTGPDGITNKQILFSKAPALAVLSDAMRHVVAGDLLALERDFRITVSGDSTLWTARLQPNSVDVSRHIDHLEIQGAGNQLLVLIVLERKGERTTTRFYP